MRTIFCVMYNLKLPKARRSASLVAHQHFGSAVSRTAQLLVLILDSARTKCYATCSVSYRYFMHKYLFVPQFFPDTYRSLAHTSINADFPSEKAPTTLVRLRISRFIRSITLFVRIFSQCCEGNSIYVNVSSIDSSTFFAICS